MSEISDKTNILIGKLQARFPTYNITQIVKPNGFKSPYIYVKRFYNPSNPDTTMNDKKKNLAVDILIGREFVESEDSQGEIAAQEIETVIEGILNLSYDCSGEITVDYTYNKDRPCRDTLLTLTL